MRKSILLTVIFLLAGFVAAPAAVADSLNVTVSGSTTNFTITGTYASTVPTTAFSSPNASYTITFSLPTSPTAAEIDTMQSGVFFGLDTTTLNLNGATFTIASQVLFYTGSGMGGGLVLCVEQICVSSSGNLIGIPPTYWDLTGSQLFTGSVSSPTFVNANAVISPLSGYQINGQGPFSFPPTPTPTPEPSSLLLLGTGLIGLCGLSRRKLRL